MNWIILDVAALSLLILFIIIGRRRGFVAMLLLLIGTLAALWTAQHFAQPVAQWVYDNYAEERLIEYVDTKLEETADSGELGALAGVLQDLSEEVDLMSDIDLLKGKAQELLQDEKQFVSSQSGQGETIPYPEGIEPDAEQQTVILQLLEEGHSLSEALVETILRPLVLSLLKMLAFLLIFILLNALIKLLIHASRIFNKLPLLGGVNRFFGGLCGLVEGLVCIYVIGIVLRMVTATAGPDAFLTTELLKETKLLSSIIYFLE